MITIVVKNRSTVVKDDQVRVVLTALQIQIDRDFCPAWGLGAFHLEMRRIDALIAPGEWQFVFLDRTSDASAFGYHDQTVNGDPIAYIGVQETMDAGGEWSVTASHELCEMALNPRLDDSEADNSGNRIYTKEACDAVEADSLGYSIASVRVSDFVLPSWFMPEVETSEPRSFAGNVSRAYELAPGGYISFIDLAHPAKSWQQQFARSAEHPERTRPGTARSSMRAHLRTYGAHQKSSAH